ncbi:MAG: glycosyltransferase [Opitutaceae bacterium]
MFLRNTYYNAKPFIPARLRWAVRRWFARRKLKKVGDIWPILESAGKEPDGWPGWPDGKQFALVLTHDVEGQRGLDNVRPLAELEMSLGFRSCFYFVPEGEYVVPMELIAWLKENGFEVGVHDLHHDGKLYKSREHFRKSAQRINHYLKEWGAVGYRSGFMFHNLDWHHDLEIEYDASTFDTDPFEPQPDGVGTIFPFWVPAPQSGQMAARDQRSDVRGQQEHKNSDSSIANTPVTGNTPPITAPIGADLRPSCPSVSTSSRTTSSSSSSLTSDLRPPTSEKLNKPRSGYVELPYTLPQDSTLFFLLWETSTRLWERKLDWIVAHGGMALLNAHPDYMVFPGTRSPGNNQIESSHYGEFLADIAARFRDQFANLLPRQVARGSRSIQRTPCPRRSRRIGMVTYSDYETDNRVRRYAESLARRGDHVEVLAVQGSFGRSRKSTLNGVHVTQLSRKASLRGSILAYFIKVSRFFLQVSGALTFRTFRDRYDLIHVHNMPDFLVFTAWMARLRGARLILDLHDLVPELFADKTTGLKARIAAGLLRLEERLSAAFAHHVIISNHLWVKEVTGRSIEREKCSVFINNVDSENFHPRQRTRLDDRRIILFHGSLSQHQGVDLVIRAMPAVRSIVPRSEFHIYGSGSFEEDLRFLIRELSLENIVRIHPPVPLERIPDLIANADVGVVAKRADSFGNRAYSTKIMEFMSQGIPVVLSRTEIDQFYFSEDEVRFFESGNVAELGAALVEVLTDGSLASRLSESGRAHVAAHSWTKRQETYLELVDNLIDDRLVKSDLSYLRPQLLQETADVAN